jgi:hypothetical protein
MRTDSHRLAGTLLALGFVAGWFSGSWVSPPTAITQVRPARPVAPPPDVPMPHIALHAVTAPATTPATARNPFVFTDRPAAVSPLVARSAGETVVAAPGEAAAPDIAAAPADSAPPMWRVFGIAADADGRITAVVSGGGDVFLLGLGDRLPDGSSVVELDATGLVVATPGGERLTLRLP